ncbi:MAG: hypothetical protein E7292_00120 [Lachnospiraceae bacterium]|nr:hypothetical protein [Lachnospiraceae bacterium]
MKTLKQNIVPIAKTILFLSILLFIGIHLSYMMRNTARESRQMVLEYFDEKEDSLDVVFVGASGIMRYWNPMLAWKEYGFTSRVLGTDGLHAGVHLAAVKEACKTQTPDVLVVEARKFIYPSENTHNDIGAIRFLDSMDYGIARAQAVKYYSDAMQTTPDRRRMFYIDLIQYHDNYEAFTKRINWELMDNRLGDNINYGLYYKGYGLSSSLAYFEDPSANLSTECEELDPVIETLYTDIIEYCRDNDITLMFVISPVVIKETESKKFNQLAQIAASYDVDFVNTNFAYDEMGIDFSRDFYNAHHTNVYGASKFTRYLGQYLCDTYDLPDHREESEYQDWHDFYQIYSAKEAECIDILNRSIQSSENAIISGEKMPVTEDAYEWLAYAKQPEITLIMVAAEPLSNTPSAESRLALKAFEVSEEYLQGKCNYSAVYKEELIYSDLGWNQYEDSIGNEVSCVISANDTPCLQIAGQEYYDPAQSGLQIVAFNNVTNEFMDKVVLTPSADGMLILQR